jgi:hypothetical protein
MMTGEQICSICYRAFTEYGHPATPINGNRCCNACNDKIVIPARIRIQRREERARKPPEPTPPT